MSDVVECLIDCVQSRRALTNQSLATARNISVALNWRQFISYLPCKIGIGTRGADASGHQDTVLMVRDTRTRC